MDTGAAVGCRRAFVEDKMGPVAGFLLGLVEDIVLVPELEDFFLGGREAEIIFKCIELHTAIFGLWMNGFL